jgi:Ni/Co efflux regulator RcnB
MKRILLAASAALSIAAPAVGFAQDDHHPNDGHPAGEARPPGPPRGGQPALQSTPPARGAPGAREGGHPPSVPVGQGGYRPQPDQPGARPTLPGGQGGFRPQPEQAGARPTFPGGQGGYRPQPGQPGYRHDGAPGAVRPGFQGDASRGVPQGWRGPRPGAQAFAYGGRQFYRYHAAPYSYPQGYYGWAGHAWRRGDWLPSVFIIDNYFIDDWYDFGLYQPQYGYEWIRVGADALLVDVSTGQIVDEAPGVYY